MTWQILQGDCIKEMAKLEEASVDAVVCDPPAGIAFMGKSWDRDRGGRDRWVEWLTKAMVEALRCCKPGAHAFVWALPRTSHWTALALEEAGWEIRDRIAHHFGTGFPKSKNLGDGVGTALKPATEDWWLARKPFSGSTTANFVEYGTGGINVDGCRIEHQTVNGGNLAENPHLRESIKNSGSTFGADGELTQNPEGRWPANVVLSHLEECEQVGTKIVKPSNGSGKASAKSGGLSGIFGEGSEEDMSGGQGGEEVVAAWDCAPGCPVAELDAQSGNRPGFSSGGVRKQEGDRVAIGSGLHGNGDRSQLYGDSGGASRFFYCAKASRGERNAGLEEFPAAKSADDGYGSIQYPKLDRAAPRENWQPHKTANHHPTVKSINFGRHLVRLVTPPGGVVLDHFAGSGSIGCSTVLEGFDFIGIEKDPEYVAITEARIAFWAQHVGRDIEEVLGLVGRSQRQEKAHVEIGQLVLEVA